MTKKIRILLIEENRLLREGISTMLNQQQDMKVFSNSETEDVLALIDKLKPNVVLIDIGLKYQNSLQLVKNIREYDKDSKIIAMDLIPSQSDIIEYVRAGVLGFILKESDSVHFIKTIRKVAKGLKVLPPRLTCSLFTQIVEHALSGYIPHIISKSAQLTKREWQVIELISEGLSNKEIAQKLNLSTYTVKSHVHNILEKLALHTRAQVIKYVHFIESSKTAADSTSLLDE